MLMAYGGNQHPILVKPVTGELCLVMVNLDPPPSSALIAATVFSANPAQQVEIGVSVLRAPASGFEMATVAGEWHAIPGQPVNLDCNTISPQRFSVTVYVGNVTIGQLLNTATFSDPISTWVGEQTASAMDLSLGGPLPLQFSRWYGSQLNASGATSALGSNWMHNYDQSLSVLGSTATVTLYYGKTVQFKQSGGTWNLSSKEDADYQLVSASGNFQFVNPPAGEILTFSAQGQLISLQDRVGNVLTVTQGISGPTAVADGLGRTLIFSYAGNLLTAVTDQTGRQVTFPHSGNSLTAATDANGKTTNYTYVAGSAPALLIATQRPLGNTPYTQQFDTAGRVTMQTDSVGFSTTLSFDQPAPGTRKITDPLGNATMHTYDASANLTRVTDPAGQTSTFGYNVDNQLDQVTDRLGNKNTIAYDSLSGFASAMTNAAGQTITLTYTTQAQGPYTFSNLSGMQFADGTSIGVTYDSKGNPVNTTDQAGKVFTSTYNARGQLLTATNPRGGVASFAYNNDGTIAAVTDPTGGVTTYAYDDKRRLSGLKFPDDTSRAYIYDALDRLVTETDERGNVTALVADANGNLTKVIDPLNRTVTLTYDTDDLVSSITDPSGRSASFKYDALGSPTAATNAVGEALNFKYDGLGRLISVIDPSGKGPSFVYDKEGNLLSVTDALGNTRTFTPDALGRSVQLMTPLGEKYSRSYDAMGRMASTTDPLARSTNYGYDNRGLLTSITMPGGLIGTFAYDDLGLLSGITDPNNNTWARTNDSAGRLLTKTDPLGRVTSYSYDARGRVKAITTPEGSLQLTRDAAGNVIQSQYSGGLGLNMAFDADSRPTTGSGVAFSYDQNGRLVSSNGLAITRDAIGRIASITYAPGKAVAYAYDARGLLATVSDWAGGSATFSYDVAGRLTGITRANGVSTRFGYDQNNRESTIDEANGGTAIAAIALQRDAIGRVTSATRNVPQDPVIVPGSQAQTFDAAGQMVGAAYDGVGRIKQDTARTYTWNQASMLTNYTSVADAASFGYDAFGMRTSRTPSVGSTEIYVLNYALGLPSIATVKSAGVDQRYYVHLPDGSLLYAIDAGNNAHHYYHFDEVGSTVFLTNDGGTVTDSYGVTPYGETVTTVGNTANPFTWLGRWGMMQEGASGLYYMRARYYDSITARFLSPDPIPQTDPRALNTYQYASGDPITNMDPSGLKGQSSAGADYAGIFLGLGGAAKSAEDYYQAYSYWANAKAAAADAAWGGKAIDWFDSQMALADTRWRTGNPFFNDPWGSESWYVNWLTRDKYMGMYQENVIQSINGSADAQIATQEVAKFEAMAAKYAKAASVFKGAGRVLTGVGRVAAGVGVAVQTGSALVQDIHNGAGVVITATDVVATGVASISVAFAPPLAVVDLVSGGAVTGFVHNALMFGWPALTHWFGRGNVTDAIAIKAAYTRFAVGRWVWNMVGD